MGRPTAIRSNSLPSGGTVATQPVPPNAVPADIQALLDYMTPAIAKFRASSSEESVLLDTMSLGVGDSQEIRLASVGLGYLVTCHHQAVFNISNSATAAQQVNLSELFPYNLVARTQIDINGGETVHAASGPADLAVALRRHRGTFAMPLSPALCRISAGAGLTLNAAVRGFSGNASISVAASTTNAQLTVDWYTFHKLAYTQDSLLGALPLQNRHVYATMRINSAPSLVATGTNANTDQSKPFYGAGANTTVALASWTVKSQYGFWSIPSNPQLYLPLISNSYQVMEQPSIALSTTGTEALVYDIPENVYLIALHVLGYDSAGTPWPTNTLSKVIVNYNAGVVTPYTSLNDLERARQFLTYGSDIQGGVPGYTLWDGDAVSESINSTDDAGWIDAYTANTPQFQADVASTLSTTATYGVCREVIAAGSVQVLG